jgi:pentatricopeptide repeat protein
MQLADVKPNSVTMVSVLLACAQLAAPQQGKWIHGYIIRCGFQSDLPVENSLLDMYAKCGRIDIARKLFEKMFKRDVITNTAYHNSIIKPRDWKPYEDLLTDFEATITQALITKPFDN